MTRERTAILILNYNGKDHLPPCLDALADLPEVRTDAAPESHPVSVWVVDNASTDGSLELVRARYPWVRLLSYAENYGFSEGYNRAIPHCDAEWLCFLNSDTRVAPDWLAALHAARVRHGVNVVASRIMTWDGAAIDFAGAHIAFNGLGLQPEYGQLAAGRRFRDRRLLCACAGSMMISRSTFLRVGGFDPDYFSYFEDVDLGWRLALAGEDTMLAADAVTYHRFHGTWARESMPWRCFLLERNALATVFKNYGDDRAGVMLLASMLLTFCRGWAMSGAPEIFGARRIPPHAAPFFLAMASFDRIREPLSTRREKVQALRVRPDESPFPLFGDLRARPEGLGEDYAEAFRRVVSICGVTTDGIGRGDASCNRLALDCACGLAALVRQALEPLHAGDFPQYRPPTGMAVELSLGGQQKLMGLHALVEALLRREWDAVTLGAAVRRVAALAAIPDRGTVMRRARALCGATLRGWRGVSS